MIVSVPVPWLSCCIRAVIVTSTEAFQVDRSAASIVCATVLHTSADDGHQPFTAGDYAAWVDDGHIEGWFSLEPGSNTALGRFELPLLQSPDCR